MKAILLGLLAIVSISVAIYVAMRVFGEPEPTEAVVDPPWVKPAR